MKINTSKLDYRFSDKALFDFLVDVLKKSVEKKKAAKHE